MKLVAGCPVMARQWIISQWIMAVEYACFAADIYLPTYVFVGPAEDPTRQVIADTLPSGHYHFVDSAEPMRADVRDWNEPRYRHMVGIRNALLGRVRQLDPDAFLSVDSDILLHPLALAHMLETASSGYDVVGGKAYMTQQGQAYPSYGHLLNASGMIRPDHSGVQSVDVVMAIKLMMPAALGVDYCYDRDGEDVGWSRAAAAAGLKLGWDGRVCNRHVMAPQLLGMVDARCGF